MIRDYESYEIVKYDEDTFGTLHDAEVVDDPAFDEKAMVGFSAEHITSEPFPFQLLGETYSPQRETWYEVITGFHTEDQAKRYVEALERADTLKAHIDKSLESTLETIQKVAGLCTLCHVLEGDGSCSDCLDQQREEGRYEELWGKDD